MERETFSTNNQYTDSNNLRQNQLHNDLSYLEVRLWTGIKSQNFFTESHNSTNRNGWNVTNNWTPQNGKPLPTNLMRMSTSWWVTRASGKTMESKQKRLVVELVRTRIQLLAQTKKIWMKTYRIFNDDLAAITFKPRKIY